MIDLLSAVALVAGTWGGLFAIFVGLGLAVRRTMGQALRSVRDLLTAFWTGWALLLVLLPCWHLGFAIDWRVMVAAASGGVAGLFWNRTELAQLGNRAAADRGLWVGITLASWAAFAYRAVGPATLYDTGVYHLGAVRWAATYPAVPGLGNLQRHLAHNSSHFLYAAALEIGPWAHRTLHLANGLLLLVLWLRVLVSVRTVLRARARARPSDLFAALLLPFVVKELLGGFFVGFSPDLVVFTLGCVLAIGLFEYLARQGAPRERAGSLLWLVALATVGVTVKLSLLMYALLTVAVAIGAYVVDSRAGGGSQRAATVLWAVGIAIGVLAPWMARGVVLSGYLMYPSSSGAFDVDWRMPPTVLAESRNAIFAWAREPNSPDPRSVLADSAWLWPWLVRTGVRHIHRVALPVALTITAIAWMAFTRGRPTRRRYWAMLLPPVGGIIFWFLTAPDPRFAGASFAVLAPVMVSVAFDGLPDARRTGLLRVGATVACAVAVLFVVRSWDWILPGADHGFHSLPRARLERFVTRSGLVLNVPVARLGRCFDAPLPCTHRPNAALELRRDGDLSYGFRLAPGG